MPLPFHPRGREPAEASANFFQAFAHIAQTVPALFVGTGRQPTPVILDFDGEAVRFKAQAEPGGSRAGMFHDIINSLLGRKENIVAQFG